MSEKDATKELARNKGLDKKTLRRALGLYFGIMLVCVALSLVAFTPASSHDQRPRVLAALMTATSTKTATPTRTPTPTITPTPTVTLTPTITMTPSQTPTDIPTDTPTPQPTPDSQDREVYVPILMYHYISDPPPGSDVYRIGLSVSPASFKAQMQWLKDNGYQALTLDKLVYALEIGRPSLPPKTVFLTFDDGYIDNYEVALPILKQMGFQATFFVLTAYADRSQPGYMTWDQMKAAHDAGIDIQVHGREHVEDKGRDQGWLTDNLGGAAKDIQDHLGYQPHFLAYPSGAYDDLTISVENQLGYWAAVTEHYGSHQEKSKIYELQRIRMTNEMTIQIFAAAISGAGSQ